MRCLNNHQSLWLGTVNYVTNLICAYIYLFSVPVTYIATRLPDISSLRRPAFVLSILHKLWAPISPSLLSARHYKHTFNHVHVSIDRFPQQKKEFKFERVFKDAHHICDVIIFLQHTRYRFTTLPFNPVSPQIKFFKCDCVLKKWLRDWKISNSLIRVVVTILKLYLSLLDEELHKKIIENNLKYLG